MTEHDKRSRPHRLPLRRSERHRDAAYEYDEAYRHDNDYMRYDEIRAHEREHMCMLEEENRRNRNWKNFLGILALILFVIALIFGLKSCMNDEPSNTNEAANQQQKNDTQQQNNQQQAMSDDLIKEKEGVIQEKIDEAKASIKDNQDNSEQLISQVQGEVDHLKNQVNSDYAQNIAEEYQDAVNKLNQADEAKENNDDSKMDQILEDVNSKLGEIKNKIDEFFSKQQGDNEQ